MDRSVNEGERFKIYLGIWCLLGLPQIRCFLKAFPEKKLFTKKQNLIVVLFAYNTEHYGTM